MLRHQLLKDFVGVHVAARFPEGFGLIQSLGRENKREQQRNGAEPQGLFHLSRASWVLASSSRSCVSWRLYSTMGMAAFSDVSLSMACSSCSFLSLSCQLAGSRAAAALAPKRTTGKGAASLPSPVSRVG